MIVIWHRFLLTSEDPAYFTKWQESGLSVEAELDESNHYEDDNPAPTAASGWLMHFVH